MARQLSKFVSLVLLAIVAAACGRKPEPAEVTVTLKESPGSLSAATVLVDYSKAGATPFKSGGEPACAAIVPNLNASFTDDGQGSLTIHANAKSGFTAPVDLAVCRMVPDAAGTTGEEIGSRLRVSLLSGTDLAGKAVAEQRMAKAGSESHATGVAAGSPGGASGGASGAASGAAERHRAGATDRAAAHQPGAIAPEGGAAEKAPVDERVAAATPPAARSQPAPAEKTKPNSLIPEGIGSNSRGAPPPPASGADEGGSDEGTGDEGAGVEDSNDETDSAGDAASYALTIEVSNNVGKLGALQFNVNHHGEGGGFAGAGGSARCSSTVPGTIATFNDVGKGTLRAGMIDLDGIDTPGPVVSCTFKSRGNVSPGDFSIEVVDVADTEGHKPTAAPQLAVNVQPQ